MAKRGEDISEERKSASSKADFIGLAGIGPELAEFVIEFIESRKSSFQCPSKDATKLKIRWTQFYLRLSNDKPFTTTP